MTNIELSDKEAEIFVALRKGKIPEVFKRKGGKAVLNFSKGGVLINIFLNDFEVYHREKRKKTINT
jgi:hypothetical protein